MAKPYSALNRSLNRLFSECFDAIDAELQQLGQQLYGDKWAAVLAHNTNRLTKGADRALTVTEKDLLIRGMKILKAKMSG